MWKITSRGFTLQEVLIMAASECGIRPDSDRQKASERSGAAPRTEIQQAPGDCHGKSN